MRRILVVEDDNITCDAIVDLLSMEDFDVCACCCASDALRVLESDDPVPDLLLVDVIMPEMSGIEFLTTISEAGGCPAALVMSGFSQSGPELRGLIESGVVKGFIQKPVNLKELLNKIEGALQPAEETQYPPVEP